MKNPKLNPKLKILRSILPALLFVWAGCAHAATPDPATAPVERLHGALIEVMKNAKALGYEGRYRKLDPVIMEVFDFPYIARVVLGPAWETLDDSQRSAFTDAFARLSVSTYAHEFDGYNGQVFETVAAEDAPRGDRFVRTRLKRLKGDPVSLDYQLHRNGQWRIVNVVARGVSDLALKRGQYRKLFEEKGFDGVMDWTQQQTAEQQAEGDGGK